LFGELDGCTISDSLRAVPTYEEIRMFLETTAGIVALSIAASVLAGYVLWKLWKHDWCDECASRGLDKDGNCEYCGK